MIIYLHMHKCAGTSVVSAAQASGLRLPSVHRNGNLMDADDNPIKYRQVPHEDFPALIQRQIDEQVDFMAMEWDFPRWEQFDALPPLRFFTSLRDPLARAISNFRMDKVAGWIDRETRFADYINGDALYCSDNYYVKILCQLWPKDTATEDNLAYALAVLARFEGVIVVEQGNMADVLARFGITPPKRRFNTFDPDAARTSGLTERELEVSQAEIHDFIIRNALDYQIYRHFTRQIRRADQPEQKSIAHV